MLQNYHNDFDSDYDLLIEKPLNPTDTKLTKISHVVLKNDLNLFYQYFYRNRHGVEELLHRPNPQIRKSSRINNSCTIDINSRNTSSSTRSTMLMRVAPLWNALPDEIVTSDFPTFQDFAPNYALERLKDRVDDYYKTDC